MSELPIALVSMPFMDAYRPSIQLGLLKSLAEDSGFPARTLHANLSFAKQVGIDYYQLLAQHRGRMIGEWLFSLEAFQERAPDPHSLMTEELSENLGYLAGSPAELKRKLVQTRHTDIPAYLDSLLEAFPWQEVAAVGFSSTFQQNTASFALARRLKGRYPHIVTIFGGANFDGDMGPELVRTVDYIDMAVIGEADESFPRLLRALATGSDIGAIPGIAYRLDGDVKVTTPAAPVSRLDDLPLPHYEEYFERAEESGILPRAGQRKVWLPIETARGCWWGAKHHCTFCGLNGATMRFRSKSPQRVLDELSQLARRYRSFHFQAVDNILELAYLTTLFPVLAEHDWGYKLFYEVKANLNREQLKLMAQAGVTCIQPGIESLSSHVLRLMKKGVRAAQNVNLLRWAEYYGIRVSWNLLWGFPEETAEDYQAQAAAIPHLRHLPPPSASGRIWLERFSPLFTGRGTQPISPRTPERSYRYVYPAGTDLGQIAYFFEYESDVDETTYEDVRQAVDAWRGAWLDGGRPSLTYSSAPGFVQICDQRRPAGRGTYTFEGTLADIYLACSERPTTAAAIRRELGLRMPVEAVQEILAEFGQRGLAFLDEQLAVALALPDTSRPDVP